MDEVIPKISSRDSSYAGIRGFDTNQETRSKIKKEIFDALAIRCVDRVYVYDWRKYIWNDLSCWLCFGSNCTLIFNFDNINDNAHEIDQILEKYQKK